MICSPLLGRSLMTPRLVSLMQLLVHIFVARTAAVEEREAPQSICQTQEPRRSAIAGTHTSSQERVSELRLSQGKRLDYESIFVCHRSRHTLQTIGCGESFPLAAVSSTLAAKSNVRLSQSSPNLQSAIIEMLGWKGAAPWRRPTANQRHTGFR